MQCSQVQEKLSAYVDGALPESSLEAVEAHLELCAECRAELEALRSIVGLAGELSDVEPPAYLSSAIRGAIAREREPSGASCAACQARLSEYIDGELSDVDVRLVESHVAACDLCGRELAILRATVETVALVGEVDPPRALRGRIAAATTGFEKVGVVTTLRGWLRSLFRLPRLGWAAGAAAVAATAAGLWIATPRGVDVREQTPVVQVSPPAPAKLQGVVTKVELPTPSAGERAVQRSVRRKMVEHKLHTIVAVRTTVSETPVPAPAKQEERSERLEASTAATTAHEPPLAERSEVSTDKEEIADKPDDSPAAEPAEADSSPVVKIAVSPQPKVDHAADFQDVKLTAEMRRRMENSIRIDVINRRF